MNKYIVCVMILAITFSISLPTHAETEIAPEIDISEIKVSISEFYRSLPNLTAAYYDPAPKNREDGIVVGKLSDKTNIIELAKDIEDGEYGAYDSLLIAHNNKLVFESYYARGRVNLPHYQASATKGYTSFAVGRAIQLGYLSMQDLHKPVLQFLKEVDREHLTVGVDKVTLHHTLSMRSGLRVSTEKHRELLKKPELLKGQKLAQAYFTQSEPVTEHSQTYHYQSLDPRITMLVLDSVVTGTVEDFIKSELLDKLKITHYFWQDNVSGVSESAHSTSMTSRDMIKWGTLLEQSGVWREEQLISKAFLTEATGSIAIPQDDDYDYSNFTYGYYFWGTKLKVGKRKYDAKLAWGGGGQYVIALEELDMVVVVTAHIREDDKTFEILEKHIVPTIVSLESRSQDESPVLEGPYLGQKPPGSTPEAFAPGIVNTRYRELSGFFSPDLKEFYLVREGGQYKTFSLVVFKNENNRWSESYMMPRIGRPIIAPDGKTMHLGKKYMERTETGWSDVKSLGPFFENMEIMRLSASSKGTYVFDEIGLPEGDGVIRYSRIINGKREEPRVFGKEINTGKYTAHPFIAPDESYLIWDSEKDSGYGDKDLYISFRLKDEQWGAAINLGDKINTRAGEGGAFVTPDGKYFFFSRNMNSENYKKGDIYNTDIFWVDAQFIEALRPGQ